MLITNSPLDCRFGKVNPVVTVTDWKSSEVGSKPCKERWSHVPKLNGKLRDLQGNKKSLKSQFREEVQSKVWVLLGDTASPKLLHHSHIPADKPITQN